MYMYHYSIYSIQGYFSLVLFSPFLLQQFFFCPDLFVFLLKNDKSPVLIHLSTDDGRETVKGVKTKWGKYFSEYRIW